MDVARNNVRQAAMKFIYWLSLTIIALSISLSGCGGGSTNPYPLRDEIPTNNCQTNKPGQGACPSSGDGSGIDIDEPSIITAKNYLQIANRVTAQLDSFIRRRNEDSPLTLAELSLLLLKKIEDNNIRVCDADTGVITITATEISSGAISYGINTSTNCEIYGYLTNAALTIRNFSTSGDLGSIDWQASADISINSLTYTLTADKKLTFQGNIAFSVNHADGIPTYLLTLTNLDTTEDNTDANDNPSSSTDRYITATLRYTIDTNLQQTLTVRATLHNTSITGQQLTVASSAPLRWTDGADSPAGGSLSIRASNGAALTLSPVDTSTMTITLEDSGGGSESACTSWTQINPEACQ